MSESTIADFVGRFIPDSTARSEPVRGRVVMSRKRLVLARDEGKTSIPLSSIFDVAVGHVPPNVSEFFDATVTIGYEQHDERTTAIVEADEATIDRFTEVLFKAELNGVEATVKHPARIGGRVTDESPIPTTVRLRDRGVAFAGPDETFAIDLSSVTHFAKRRREIGGETRPTICVRHMPDGRAMTTEIAIDSPREMNLLGRYLRLEYVDLLAELRDLEITEEAMEVLVALYSGGGEADVADVLGIDASSASMLLSDLEGKGLVSRGSGGVDLTATGRLAVSDRIEDVNS